MKRLNLVAGTLAAVALMMGATAASAKIVDLPISGSVAAGGHFYGSISLDVVDGQAISGGGSINIYGLVNAPLALITYSTPGFIPWGDGLLGFRGNDGTDFLGLDTAFPISANGLLFDVGATTPEWGLHPLFAIWANGDGTFGSAFTGGVAGTEHWAEVGTAAIPEPATWAMMVLGFGVLGGGLRVARRRRSLAQAAA
jgi:hypothetical protein